MNRKIRSCAWLLGLAVSLGACASRPQVAVDGLPVKRVVVYRNGVAYFEREGQVEGEQVHFRLRQENVGDFLATLAILEKGESQVRAASFPVELDTDEEEPEEEEGSKPKRRKDKRSQLRTVSLELEGKKHDLLIGYLAETPVWRPSYRLVVGDQGKAELQAWAIVQNQSGEDWKDVELSLVAGAPIAFESTLGDPVIPPRPIVTDSGEVVLAVPEGSASYYQQEQAASEPEWEMEEASLEDAQERADSANKQEGLLSGSSKTRPAAKVTAVPAPTAPRPQDGGAPGGGGMSSPPASALAHIEVQSGSTQYQVPHRVTIPNQSATMVLLASERIPGETVHLFAPDAGVPDSYRHPFRVVRFKNESRGLLEKGPIAVFEKGSFLGQGLMDSLPQKASATVPFALARGLAVEKKFSSDQRDARLYSIQNGRLKIQQDHARIHTYSAQNGEEKQVRLLVRHELSPQVSLYQPPQGTEENKREGVALIPLTVPAFGSASVPVEERLPVEREVSFQSPEGRAALLSYLNGEGKGKPEAAALQKILSFAEDLSKNDESAAKLRGEQSELEKLSRETRLSLSAIEKNPQAGQLRAELTNRLQKTTTRLDALTKELVELGLRRSELEVHLKEVLLDLQVAPPDQRGKS